MHPIKVVTKKGLNLKYLAKLTECKDQEFKKFECQDEQEVCLCDIWCSFKIDL